MRNLLAIALTVVAVAGVFAAETASAACPVGWLDITAQVNNPAYLQVCANPKGSPDLKISAQWGSTNVGNTIYGPKLTAFLAVTNVGTAPCVPPAGQVFAVGAYVKSLGLIEATSVGPFPTTIAPGQTVNFVAQGVNQLLLTELYQNQVYNGFVDFYVASRAPAGPKLSAATQSACASPELSITNNNAHSVKKAITNP